MRQAICLFLPFIPLAAQAADRLDAIVVTPTRTAQTADETLSPVIIIDRKEIERSAATDLADLLRFHAGIDIARNGDFGQASSVFIRGAESNHTQILIDGVKINPGTIGGAAVQNILPTVIERIEIVKGPRSALYGSEAIGGVINVITRRAEDGLELDAGLGAGEFDTRRGDASALYQGEKFSAGVTASRLETDGYAISESLDEEQAFDNTNVNAYLGGEIGGADVELRHWQAGGNVEYVSFGQALDSDFENAATALAIANDFGARLTSTLRLSRVIDDIDQNQPNFLGEFDFAETVRDQLYWQNDIALGSQQLLTFGLSYVDEQAESSVFGSSFDEDTMVKAAFVQDDLQWGRHHVIAAARYTEHEDFGNETTWNVDYGYQATDKLRLTAGAATGFRAPDAADRFGFGGDPNLDPETARNLEGGLRYRLGTNQLVRASVFENRIDDLITFVRVDPDSFFLQARNVQEARIRGLELAYLYEAKALSLIVEGIVQDPQNETDDEILARRPRRSLTGTLFYNLGRYRLGAQFLAVSERKDSPFSDAELGGYGLLNLTGGIALSSRWRLNAKLENVFDKDYEAADGFETRGRFLFVELRYTLKH